MADYDNPDFTKIRQIAAEIRQTTGKLFEEAQAKVLELLPPDGKAIVEAAFKEQQAQQQGDHAFGALPEAAAAVGPRDLGPGLEVTDEVGPDQAGQAWAHSEPGTEEGLAVAASPPSGPEIRHSPQQ